MNLILLKLLIWDIQLNNAGGPGPKEEKPCTQSITVWVPCNLHLINLQPGSTSYNAQTATNFALLLDLAPALQWKWYWSPACIKMVAPQPQRPSEQAPSKKPIVWDEPKSLKLTDLRCGEGNQGPISQKKPTIFITVEHTLGPAWSKIMAFLHRHMPQKTERGNVLKALQSRIHWENNHQ